MAQPTIVSVNIGGVETFAAPDGRPLTTGIRKQPVDGRFLGRDGFPGDASSEADHHTPARALHLFSEENYGPLEASLGLTLPRPGFGENLTTAGMLDQDVCVGDLYRAGAALFRVTQPTERCRTIGRSLGVPKILKMLHAMEACGFYASVVEPGLVSAGDRIELQERPRPMWCVRRLHRVMFRELADARVIADVRRIPELAEEWKRRLEVMCERSRRGEPLNSSLGEVAALDGPEA